MEGASWGVVGHEWAVSLLQRALRRKELSHAYLFTGPEGVGKMTLAQALARALLCSRVGESPCGTCQACRLTQSGSHPDLHVILPATRSDRIGISQVRELTRQLSLTPSLGRYRVAILADFDRASPSAANALLKTLEEPPAYAILVLLAPDADSLLPTVVSRCQVVPLRPLPLSTVARALEERWGVDPERARLLAHLSGGRLGWAVRASRDPSVLERRRRWLEDLSQLLQASLVDRFRYAEALAEDEAVEQVLQVWSSWWRDVMVLAAGAEGMLTNSDMLELLRRHAQHVGLARARAVVDATCRTADLLRRNVNRRLALEVLVGFDLPRL